MFSIVGGLVRLAWRDGALSIPTMDLVKNARVHRFANPAALGLFLGVGFGLWNLVLTMLDPVAEDTPGALAAFYGPMFVAWAIASYVTTGRTGRLRDGIKAAVVVAFVTFCVLDLFVIMRANLFLHELSARSDWRALMAGFPASGFKSLRRYINYHYLSQAPFKIVVASVIGLGIGVVGGSLARLKRLDIA
jgi:hypothetical protein